ncbi:MAG: LuxR C-terminal-related transcriptional regulator [Cyclobacteriaceae bacterium]
MPTNTFKTLAKKKLSKREKDLIRNVKQGHSRSELSKLIATERTNESRASKAPKPLNKQVFLRTDHHINKSKLPDFTKKEILVLQQMSFGTTTNELAAKLSLSPNTIKTHMKNMLKKSGSSNSVMLIANALRQGIIE